MVKGDFMKIIKRLLSLILTLALVMGFAVIAPSAQDGGISDVGDGDRLIDTIDIGNIWTYPYISNNPDCAPCFIPFIVTVRTADNSAYVDNEIWTDTADHSTSSKKAPAALKPGHSYRHSVVIKAQEGYRFSNDPAVTYLRETCPAAAIKTLSEDRTMLTVEGLEKATFQLDTPRMTGIANVYGGVQLKWNAVKGAVKYRVFRKDAKTGWKKIADTTALSLIDKTPVSGTKYTYTVRCISADGKVMASGYNTAGFAITHFASPVISKFENINGGTKMTWKAVKGAAYYRVLVKSGNTWKKLGDTNSTSFVAKKRVGGTKYTYTVRAMNAGKKYIGSYNANGWACLYVATPGLPTVWNTKSGIQVYYIKPKGGVWFRIFRKTGSGKWVKLIDTTSTKILDTTAKNGVKYAYTVRCISADKKRYLSGFLSAGRSIVCYR